jgi:predicted enzyme related to lactoylglutathione lyase
MSHTLCWFDLDVKNLERAVTFYHHVLNRQLDTFDYEGHRGAVFSHEHHDVAGCLVESTDFKPNDGGLLPYFNVEGRLDASLKEVEKYGGQIIAPKHAIGPNGFRAIILDSEGNRVALHSM